MKARAVLTAVIALGTACHSPAADWPQWQGPDRNAKSADTGLLKQGPENGPPLACRSRTACSTIAWRTAPCA
jgi:hypothetical protein